MTPLEARQSRARQLGPEPFQAGQTSTRDSDLAREKQALPERLDRERLDFLQQLGAESGVDLLGDVIRLFEQHTHEKLLKLNSAIEARDFEHTRRLAHSIKGGGREIGAQRLSEICQRCEAEAQHQSVEGCAFWRDELRNEFQNVLNALRAPVLVG